jgi:hypothetical protein
MSSLGAVREKGIKSFCACAVAALFFVASCGGGSGGSTGAEVTNPDASLGDINSIEQMIYSDAYTGELVVYFDEDLGVRINSEDSTDSTKATIDPVISVTSVTNQLDQLGPIQDFIETRPAIMIARFPKASPELVDRRRAKLERLSGKELTDWNSVYTIEESDPDEAVLLLRELNETYGVSKVYPRLRPGPADLFTTPSLTGHQEYLNDEATYGGLNAQYAWTAGVTGSNIFVVDNEPGMNFDHEEFSLVKDDFSNGGNFFYTPSCAPGFPEEISNCDSWIAHGTAVTGILIAGHNSHGVNGFAPDAYYIQGSMSGGVSADLYSHGQEGGDVEPGSIWLLEVQLPGKYNTSGWCGGDVSTQYGCMPVELWPDVFDQIEVASAFGITVIEGGGNGQMNLNNPDLYSGSGWDFAKDLSCEDSGAVLVGASEGANEAKIFFSNCGSRVNSFSWGQGVVTTGYPYGSYAWEGTTPPLPPNDTTNAFFIDNFGGTSSATALVGGAAVLIQDYARTQLGHRRYLMPPKMREILTGSGVAQTDTSGCNIGMQPRIDQAFVLVNTFVTSTMASYPELAADEQLTDEQHLALRALGVGIICKEYDWHGSDPSCPDSEIFPEGTKISADYDFDGDDRADLVKFRNGSWKVDLSSVGTTDDGYGSWDVNVSFTPLAGEVVWPYVADMNSDGRSDFVVYDKLAGTFYVALTDSDLLKSDAWHGWDWTIDYSSQWHDEYTIDPDDADYSRPFIAQYNQDGFLDIGIVCSDGDVRVDYGDGTPTGLGSFDWNDQLITDPMLAAAPGWAYLPAPVDYENNGTQYFTIKVPDTHPHEGRMYIIPNFLEGTSIADLVGEGFHHELDYMEADGVGYIFGGSNHVPTIARLDSTSYPNIGIKNSDWVMTDYADYSTLYTLPPSGIYGGPECHPVFGKFDSDEVEDRVVMCPDGWRIAYSSDEYASLLESDGSRHVPLTYTPGLMELPGRSYAGGITYAYARELMEQYAAMHPGQPVPILVDMVTIATGP